MLPKFRKLLYASDLGDNAAMVFAHAVALARAHGATIIFVHAMEPLSATGRSLVRNILPEDQLQELESTGLTRLRNEIDERIDRFCAAELGDDSKAREVVSEVHIVEGHPADVIVGEAARTGADLIVLGTHSRRGVQRVLLGSVAHKVVSQTGRPVLLVPIPEDIK